MFFILVILSASVGLLYLRWLNAQRHAIEQKQMRAAAQMHRRLQDL